MRNKPIFFTILSVLCFIEPAIKVLYFKATTHFDFSLILTNLSSRNSFFDVVDFWLVFPMAGLLVLKMRKWSYFAFMSVLGYIIYDISTYEKYTWPYNAETPFMYNYVVAAMSLAVFVYFLMPKTRQPFFDKRIRWWEPQTRYQVNISCRLQGEHLTFPSEILNISRSGAFLADGPYLKVGEKLLLEFTFMGHSIEVPVEIVHKHTIKNHTGYGVKFTFSAYRQNLKIGRVIRLLKNSHGEFSAPKEPNLAA